MKVALVHYHLNTGGVTTILRRQIAALADSCDLLVLTGESGGARLPCPLVEIPALGYDRPDKPPVAPRDTADQVLTVLRRRWPGGCDLMHVHNPLLAKNRQLINVVNLLQQAGIPLFLQIHDFAEDGRPQAYTDEPYPRDCHYGVINQRDRDALRAAGLSEMGLHYLPNAVGTGDIDAAWQPKAQILYPVRAIRRKNLGEAVLLSLFFKNGRRLGVTQPPTSPMDIVSYRDWTAWIGERRLPIDLEVAKHRDYRTLVADSESIVTTSVAEGFGMAFLEPWTAGKPLWGRYLPDLCTDFETRGIRLEGLYDSLNVPLEWIDQDHFSARWRAVVCAAADRFGYPLSEHHVAGAFDQMTGDGTVDFGLLNEALQRQILSRLLASRSAAAELMGLNPWLASTGGHSAAQATIETNRAAVMRHFGPDRYRERLKQTYERVVTRPVRHSIEKAVLRDAFFRLDRFSLLTWGPYEPA